MGMKIKEKNKGAVKRRLRLIDKRADNPEGAWPRVGSYLSRQVRRQFVTEGSHFGKKWRPLKKSYRLWKVRHGHSRKILVQTGSMRDSFTRRPMAIEEYQGKSAVFGSDHRLAKFHQYGTRRHGKQVNPPRPMLIITKEVRQDIRDILAKYVTGKREI